MNNKKLHNMTPNDLVVGKLYEVQSALSTHYQKHFLFLGTKRTTNRTIQSKTFQFLTPTGHKVELSYSLCAYYLYLNFV